MPGAPSITVPSKSGVRSFEDLVAWQKARVMVGAIYAATRSRSFARDWSLTSQIQRAAVSVMSNIAEGFERNQPREFFQFLGIAKASCAEVRSLLHVALDVGYIDQKQFDTLIAQSREVARIIGGLRAAVERKLNG